MSDCVVSVKGCLVKPASDLFTGWVRCEDMDLLKSYGDVELPVDVKEGIKWNPDRKIPADLFKKVLGTVRHYPHMETGYVIYRNGMTNTWDIRAPEQKGSAAHVNFFEEEHPDHAFQLVGTIHTHPEMAAFWSGTDRNDQTKKPGTVHMVLGLKDGHVQMTLCTVFMKDAQYDVPFDEIVEPVDFAADYEPVQEWVAIIDKQSYVPPVATYNPWSYGCGYGKHTGGYTGQFSDSYGGQYDDLYDDWYGIDRKHSQTYPAYGGYGGYGGYKQPTSAAGNAKTMQVRKLKARLTKSSYNTYGNERRRCAARSVEDMLQALESLLSACLLACNENDVQEVVDTALGQSQQERAEKVAEEAPVETLRAALEAIIDQPDDNNDAAEALNTIVEYMPELEAMEALLDKEEDSALENIHAQDEDDPEETTMEDDL